jgi:hypothetical protein
MTPENDMEGAYLVEILTKTFPSASVPMWCIASRSLKTVLIFSSKDQDSQLSSAMAFIL